MASFSRQKVIVPLRPGSNGDPSHIPSNPAYKKYDPPTLYLEKLATEWMKARGEAKNGVSYALERLPHGYTVFEKVRSDKKHIDRWVYGHPERKTFDSPNRFYPHFEHLMNNAGDSMGCPCSVCVKNGVLHRSTPTSTSSSRRSSTSTTSTHSRPTKSASGPFQSRNVPPPAPSQVKGRPKIIPPGMDANRIDEEGTPDVWRNLIDKLKRHITLDQPVEEQMSMDWRAEQALLQDLLRRAKNEPQWAPRVGELVLYVRNSTADNRQLDLVQNSAGELKLYDPLTDSHFGPPQWAAGHVTQVPELSVDDQDERSITLSGVRVEPLPNPNNGNKNLSKKYQYVPVSHTRPFFLWNDYLQLQTLEPDDWHCTIQNALTCMSTMSLVGRHRFQGQWPAASIWCHGIYIGAELLMVGDTVRLLPKTGVGHPCSCTDIMVVKSIRLKLSNLDCASSNDYDDGRPYNSEAWIFGAAYTIDDARSNKLYLDHKNNSTPKAADGYAKTWYPLHPSSKEMAVPFSRIMGRLYEYDAMQHYMSMASMSMASLDQGRENIIEGRLFARRNDNRILKSPGSTWFWGDSRTQALDLQTVNGLEVGIYDTERDPNKYRKAIKIIDGVAPTTMDRVAPTTGKPDLRRFMAPAMEALPIRKHHSSVAGQKRKIDDDDDEEGDEENGQYTEDEFRQHTIVIDDDNADEEDELHVLRTPISSEHKKVKVMVAAAKVRVSP